MPEGANQFTEKQLKFGYWLVTHKLFLRKLGYGILIVFDALLLIYAIYGLVDYYLISWNRALVLERDLGRSIYSHDVAVELSPRPLAVESVNVFGSGGDRRDFLAVVQNSNTDWYARFKYRFVFGGNFTPEAAGFILPSEEKYVAQLAQDLGAAPRSAELEITEILWQRVNRKAIRDYGVWRDDRMNFTVREVVHEADAGALGRGVSRTSFEIRNNTAFGYWRLGLNIVLLRGNRPVAVNFITLDNFDSGQMRRVDVHWFEVLPTSSSVDIAPEVDLFDPLVYLPPRSR